MISENAFGRTEYVLVKTENGPIVVEIDEGGIEWADNEATGWAPGPPGRNFFRFKKGSKFSSGGLCPPDPQFFLR